MTARDVLLAKKRMMFIKGEDYNYLSYNIIMLLYSVGAVSASKAFKDHRKLAFLVDFVARPDLASIVSRRNRLRSELSKRDLRTLASAYADGESRKHFVERVLFALSSNNKISISKQQDAKAADVVLIVDAIPEPFLVSPIFDLERNNIRLIRSIAPHIRTCGLSAFLQNFFTDQGVPTWHS